MDRHLNRIARFRPVMDQPVGKAAVYAAGFGVASGLSGLVRRMINLDPRIASVAAALLLKTRPVQSRLGNDTAELLATTAWIDAVVRTFDFASLFARPFEMVGAGHVQPLTGGYVADSGIQSMIAGIPLIGPMFSGAYSAPANEGDLAGYVDDYGLGAAPLLLTSAEEKVARIRV